MQSDKNSEETVPIQTPEKKLKKSIKPNKQLLWLLVLVLFASGIYGVYAWQNGKVKKLNTQVNTQQQEIQTLKSEKSALEATQTKPQDDNQIVDSDEADETSDGSEEFSCGEPKFSENGGPLPGHIRTDKITWMGDWSPDHIDVKVGTTVTWSNDVGGEIGKIAIESDAGSCEKFSSRDFGSGDSHKQTFNKVGVFGWHDTYDGNDSGHTITVYE